MEVVYEAGIPSPPSTNITGIAAAVALATTADDVIVALGQDLTMARESHDSEDILLTSAQRLLVEKVAEAASRPIVGESTRKEEALLIHGSELTNILGHGVAEAYHLLSRKICLSGDDLLLLTHVLHLLAYVLTLSLCLSRTPLPVTLIPTFSLFLLTVITP